MGDYNADPDPNLEKITSVAFGYAFAPQDNLKVDQFSTDSSDKVYNLTRRIGSTRLRVKVDPAQVPSGLGVP